ncbi:unnamed protein product, partial [Soboliphyme baturini]|uniref:E3 ubiquitin protein ligase n=1 Tax=Soboliphyme baturini TaxID=241478 RepID=A0A183J314_9BILA
MRQLLASYKIQNEQLKAEVSRFKRKWKEAVSSIAKVQKELEQERKAKVNAILVPLTSSAVEDNEKDMSPEEGKEPGELDESDVEDEATRNKDYEYRISELKKRIRKLQKKYRASQITMDGFRHVSNCEKEIVEVLKEVKLENHRLRSHIRNAFRKRAKEGSLDEANKHAKRLEEQLERLKKDVTISKQEEETLLKELEVTGQAFEEIQEQNGRLMQQLSEKDDANFKLMSERIRSNQQQKLLREQINLMEQEKAALDNQYEAQAVVVRNLEMKERLLEDLNSSSEKELALRYKAMEENRKKAMELAQMVVDLKFQVEKLTSEVADAKENLLIKTAALEDETFKTRRLEDEMSVLRKRLERLRKMEKGSATDEVLLEEVRSLKEQLTCPSCKVQRKDAMLAKCFHVFCMSCLKTRYETRQRKCPKCNCAFGA